MPANTDQLAQLEADPLTWRLALFEQYLTDTTGQLIADGPHHRAFWIWAWAIVRGRRPKPFVAVWARGGAKSTNAELMSIALGARDRRRYAWYICEVQEQADDHVQTIGAMLETRDLATFYPELAARRVNKYGSSKGWRRNRLSTRAGFTIDAVGLDTAARGIKLEEDRPDLFVFDDIDGRQTPRPPPTRNGRPSPRPSSPPAPRTEQSCSYRTSSTRPPSSPSWPATTRPSSPSGS